MTSREEGEEISIQVSEEMLVGKGEVAIAEEAGLTLPLTPQ